MILQAKVNAEFTPHPEGIFPAVCVDVIDLGLMESEFQGRVRMVNKVRLVFETEQKDETGKNRSLAKTFTASLNAKAKLAEFLGKWRGRPVLPGETIDLGKLLGVCCTLVLSHQQSMQGRIYASIDAISKPTKKLAPSGTYDPVAARQQVEEWKAGQTRSGSAPNGSPTAAPGGAAPATKSSPGRTGQQQTTAPISKSPAPTPAQTAAPDFDPEVGF